MTKVLHSVRHIHEKEGRGAKGKVGEIGLRHGDLPGERLKEIDQFGVTFLCGERSRRSQGQVGRECSAIWLYAKE